MRLQITFHNENTVFRRIENVCSEREDRANSNFMTLNLGERIITSNIPAQKISG